MPRIEIPGFVGGFDAVRAKDAQVCGTWNGLVESISGQAKAPAYLRKRPGVRPFATVPGAASIRGLFYEDGRAFVVGGTTFAEFDENGTLSNQETVLEDANPATMHRLHVLEPSPIEQLLVISGGLGIVFDMLANSVADVTAPNLSPPYSMGLFIDGYGIIVKTASPQFNFSDVQDFSTFPALNLAARSEADDNISFMVRNHRELIMIGTKTGEVWQDDGVTPFSPIQGVFIEQGSIAPYAGVQVDNTVYWLSGGQHGSGIVFRLNGYTPERVSTFAVEYWLSQSSDLSKAIGYSMQIGGHLLYLLYVPDLPWTWVFDIASGVWTVWTRWNTTLAQDFPWFGRCHCFAFDRHLIGDRSSGTIYETSFEFEDDLVSA